MRERSSRPWTAGQNRGGRGGRVARENHGKRMGPLRIGSRLTRADNKGLPTRGGADRKLGDFSCEFPHGSKPSPWTLLPKPEAGSIESPEAIPIEPTAMASSRGFPAPERLR